MLYTKPFFFFFFFTAAKSEWKGTSLNDIFFYYLLYPPTVDYKNTMRVKRYDVVPKKC